MKILLNIAILTALFPVHASECVDFYSEKIKIISEINSENEAIHAYCSGEPNFKAMSGIEYLILEVPNHWLKKNIKVEELYYQDGIKCDEQRQHLQLQENYTRVYNIQMVKCLESSNSCCPNKAQNPSQ